MSPDSARYSPDSESQTEGAALNTGLPSDLNFMSGQAGHIERQQLSEKEKEQSIKTALNNILDDAKFPEQDAFGKVELALIFDQITGMEVNGAVVLTAEDLGFSSVEEKVRFLLREVIKERAIERSKRREVRARVMRTSGSNPEISHH